MEEDGLGSHELFGDAVERSVGLVALTIEHVVNFGLKANHEPNLANWYHGALREGTGRFTSGVRKKLASGCSFVIQIDDASARQFHSGKQEVYT